MPDHTTRAPRHLGRRRAIRILAVANPDASSSSDSDENAPADTYITKPSSKPHVAPNLPTGKGSNDADAGSSQRQSAVRLPSVPRALPLPPTQAAPQRLVTKERIVVAATSDGESYVVVDLTGLTDSQAIRERMLSKLHIPDDLRPIFGIYRTELGWIAIGGALDDNQLMIDCQHFGDDKGTLKFLIQPSDVSSESPAHWSAPASGATTVPPYISTPFHNHSCRPSETDCTHERVMAPAAEERHRGEENERWMGKKRAELAAKRQQWAHDHPNLDNADSNLAYQNGVGTTAGSSAYDAPTAGTFPQNRTGSPVRTPNTHGRRLIGAQQQQQPQAPIREQDSHYGRQLQQARQPPPGGQPFVAPPRYPQPQAYLSQKPQQPSDLLRPPPLPQTPQQTNLLPAPIGAKYTDFAQQQRPQSANDMLLHSSRPGHRPTMQRTLSEHDRPSTPDLDRSPPLPQTPQHRMLPLASDNNAAAPSASGASLVGYAGQVRDTNSDHDSTTVTSKPDTTNVNLEAGSCQAVQRMVDAQDGPGKVTPPIPTAPSSLVSQSIAPATNPQPAYIQRQSKVIHRDFAAAVQEEESDESDESDDDSETLWKIPEQNLAPPATARTTVGAPLAQRMATRPAGSSNGGGIGSEVPSQSSLQPHESSSSSSWDTVIPVSNIVRKRSTKMWGSRVEEVAPGLATLGIGAALNAPDTNPEGVLGREQATFKWVKGELIGQGSFGRVYHAMNLTTGELIAVKQIELPKAGSNRADSRQMSVVDAVKSESNMLRDLDHPHIVQYLGFEETMDVFSLFMEYVPGGSIGGFLSKVGKFEDEVVRSFSHQIIDGLAYLHKSDILHRDLKGNSILVDRSGICKISDFSISKHSEHVYKNDEGIMMRGSVFWAAPEMLYNNNQGYSAKVDIWSVGCVVLEMQTGLRPWAQDDMFAVMYKVGQLRQIPPIPDNMILDPLADDFRKNDPAERPTATELLTHPWLQVPPGWVFTGFKENSVPATISAGTTETTTGAPLVLRVASPQPDTIIPVSDIRGGDIPHPSKMSVHEMFEYLIDIGCPDLTQSIDPSGYSKNSIATGGFGDIFKGKLNDGTPIAIKVWRSRALDEELGKAGKRAMREIYNWSQLDHENIQKLLGVIVFNERLGMVSKWMERGNLQEYLQKNPHVDGYPLCIQIAQGVEYIHNKNMIHGDLKATNILVSPDHKLKLTDFDYSIMAESTVFSQTTRIGGGTLRWMAPELALDSEGDHQRNKQTDIYALGMTFLETIGRAVPYYPQCKTDGGVFAALSQKRFPQRDPSFFGSDQRGNRMWALLMHCWDHDPVARPIAAEVTVLLQTLVRETESRNAT